MITSSNKIKATLQDANDLVRGQSIFKDHKFQEGNVERNSFSAHVHVVIDQNHSI